MSNIAKGIYYVGVNDRTTPMFERLWSLPSGVSYNSYLIVDDKTVLVDTLDTKYIDSFLAKIEKIIGDRPLDYIVVNHMEPDHSASISVLKQKYPNVQIVGNAKTVDMLKGYHGDFGDYITVKDGGTLSIGSRELSFCLIPFVHWPETMATYDSSTKTIFSGDAFGCFGALNGGVVDSTMNLDIYWDEMIRYYSCIVGKYGIPTKKAIEKISALEIDTICTTHGPVWREYKDKVIALYDKMSQYKADKGLVIAYGSMYGNTAQMAEAIAVGASDAGLKDIVLYDVSQTNHSYMIRDIFKYSGLIVGSPTYSGELFPPVAELLSAIKSRGVKGRIFSSFSSFTWAGIGEKKFAEFAENMKWEQVTDHVILKQGFSNEAYDRGYAMGVEVAKKILSK